MDYEIPFGDEQERSDAGRTVRRRQCVCEKGIVMEKFNERKQENETVGEYVDRLNRRLVWLEQEVRHVKNQEPLDWDALEKLIDERKHIPTLIRQASREQFRPWAEACLESGHGDTYDIDMEDLSANIRNLIVDVAYQIVRKAPKTREDVAQALLYVVVPEPD